LEEKNKKRKSKKKPTTNLSTEEKSKKIHPGGKSTKISKKKVKLFFKRKIYNSL
jgi:hypothetical protein